MTRRLVGNINIPWPSNTGQTLDVPVGNYLLTYSTAAELGPMTVPNQRLTWQVWRAGNVIPGSWGAMQTRIMGHFGCQANCVEFDTGLRALSTEIGIPVQRIRIDSVVPHRFIAGSVDTWSVRFQIYNPGSTAPGHMEPRAGLWAFAGSTARAGNHADTSHGALIVRIA